MKNINKKLIEILDKKDGIKEEIHPDEKIKQIFNKIEFLKLDDKSKGEVAQKIKNDAEGDKLYWFEIFLAAGIATLGLLQDSVAVIIGAMLIAPLLRPINGLAYSIATGESGFFRKSAFLLALSILFSIFIGWFITYILNLDIQTSGILSRVNPTILDLFVASLSAIVAILSLKFSRLGESVAGVAMAASLMPPLAVVGIEIALKNYDLALGAFMLFLTNLIAILLVGVILFWMYGFNPHKMEQNKKVMKRLAFVILTLIIISIPLFHSLQVIKKENILKKEIHKYVTDILKTKISNFKLEKVDIKNIKGDSLNLDLVLKLPENISFYNTFKDELDYSLSKKIGKNVKLNIELIRMANIVSKVNKKPDQKLLLGKFIKDLFSKSQDFQLVNFDIQEIKNGEKSYIIKLVGVMTNTDLTEKKLKEKYEKIVKEKFPNTNFIWVLLPKYEEKKIISNKIDPINELYKKIYYKRELFLNQILFNNMYYDNLKINFQVKDKNKKELDINDVKNMNVSFNLYIPSNISTGQLEVIYTQIQNFNKDFPNSKLNIKEFNYKILDF